MKDREEYISILEQDNAELKEQLEEADRKLFFTKNELDMRQKSIDNKLTQEKEFIKYLEDEIKHLEHSRYVSFNEFGEHKLMFYKEILQKYKEIIGVLDEKK